MTVGTHIDLTQTIKLPVVGFGTYLISDEDVRSAVGTALRLGYRHVDTAEVYGNETGVGSAIRAVVQEQGISREEMFVTTKLWPGNAAWGDTPKTYETTIASLNSSLARLQLDYVDLYLIHAPFDKAQRLEQWRGMVELREQEKAKAIGVSNFSKTHIEEITAAGCRGPTRTKSNFILGRRNQTWSPIFPRMEYQRLLIAA